MQQIQLSIPTACHEDWNKMSPNQQGRFCGSCAKTVVDFSDMTDAQMILYFENLKHADVCGRVYPDQLNRTLQEAPVMQQRKKMYWVWQYAAALLLFFTKGIQAKAQGGIKGQMLSDTTKKIGNMPDMPVRMGGLQRINHPENVHVVKAPIIFLFITDENNQPIAGASVQLFPQEKLMISDSEGRLNLGKNHKITEVKITATGYEGRQVFLKDVTGNGIQLKKDVVVLEAVTIQGDYNALKGKVAIAGGISVMKGSEIKELPAVNKNEYAAASFSIYPNPVQKGKEISFTISAKDKKAYKILISDADGKLMMQQNIMVNNKAQQEKLSVPALWSSGMYIISLVNENGSVVQSEKIMLL